MTQPVNIGCHPVFAQTTRVIVRIDDVGVYDPVRDRIILALCKSGISISCGVVPKWLTQECQDFLIKVADSFPGHLEVHQHGYIHTNYAPQGEKYEFGPKRSTNKQRQDIDAGRKILEEAFGSLFFPVFSPPFGWYDTHLLLLLKKSGFVAVSGLWNCTADKVIPVISPSIDCFQWDPLRERDWEEIVSEWKTKSVSERSGIVLHPRFMSPTSVSVLSEGLSELLKEIRTATFAELLGSTAL